MTDATYEQNYRDRTNQNAVEEVERLREQVRMTSWMGEGYALMERRAILAEAEVARLKAELEARRGVSNK